MVPPKYQNNEPPLQHTAAPTAVHRVHNGMTPIPAVSASAPATHKQHGQRLGYTPSVAGGATVFIGDFIATGRVRAEPAASARVGNTRGRGASKLLFGTNFADYQQFPLATGYTAHRWGGNAVTRYAWELDVQNRARDYFFENVPNDVSDVGKLPNGSSSDAFLAATLAAGATPVLTIPTIGVAPFDRNRRCGFSVAKYGAQNASNGDCGN